MIHILPTISINHILMITAEATWAMPRNSHHPHDEPSSSFEERSAQPDNNISFCQTKKHSEPLTDGAGFGEVESHASNTWQFAFVLVHLVDRYRPWRPDIARYDGQKTHSVKMAHGSR